MTFWGTEVKPGKPFTHKANDSKGRLHISMATLAFSAAPATTKSVLQCNVGNKSPVYLCSLYPRISESLQLHLEFDEVDDVILSVIGPRSIHISGYYLGSGRRSGLISDSESYGEDIAESETQRSDNSEDKYEDSFIDDDDLEVLKPSFVSISEDKKSKSGKRKRLRKKCIVSESNDEPPSQHKHAKCSYHVPVVENENDDSLPISSLCKSKTTSKKVACEENKLNMEIGNKKTEDGGNSEAESQRNIEDDVVNGQAKRKSDLPIESLMHLELSSGNDGISNKKCKHSREGEIQAGDTEADRVAQNLNLEDGQQQKMANDTSVGTENEKRPKKRRKKQTKEVKAFEADSAQHKTVVNENKTETVANENKTGQDDHGRKDERMGKDLPISSDQNHYVNHHIGQESCAFTEEKKIEEKKAKKKKKKSKTRENEEAADADTLLADGNISSPMEIKSENVNAVKSEVRTLENGLVIELIERGKPDGKIASSGKKISVSYVGKLKNGEVIESTMGSSPYKFCLGAGSVIEGWEVGIDGMHVGEKRRLVIPPSLGYGSEGDGKNIPPNSWLIYDIELNKVRP